MLTGNEYLLAWGLYLIGLFCLALLWYRLLRLIPVRWLRNVLLVLFFALLATPVLVIESGDRLAPAAMIWLLESTIIEPASLQRVYISLAVSSVIGLVLAFGEAFFYYRRRHPGT